MASKKGYLIPEVIDPPTRRCVTVFVPDDQLWWAAFWGQMTDLVNSWYWEGTYEQQVEVTGVWNSVLETARQSWNEGNCGMADCEECLSENLRIRVNAATGDIEISTDGGITFVNSGDTINYFPQPSPNTGVSLDTRKCNIGFHLSDWLSAKWDDAITEFEAYADVISAADSFVAFFLPGYVIVDQVLDFMNEIAEAGVNACRAEDTVERRELVKCWFYCNLPDDLIITDAVWADFVAYFESLPYEFSVPSKAAYDSFMASFNAEAMDAQARYGEYQSGACGDCPCAAEWTYTFDFELEESFLGWVNRPEGAEPTIIAAGLEANAINLGGTPEVHRRWIRMQREMPYFDATTRIKSAEYMYTNSGEGNSNVEPLPAGFISPRIYDSGSTLKATAGNPPMTERPNGTLVGYFVELPELAAGDFMLLCIQFAQHNEDGVDVTGSGILQKLIISGDGKNPFIP